MTIAQKSLAIIATAAVAVAVVFSFVTTIKVAEASTLTSAQVQAIVSLLQSFGASSSTIANVETSLNGGTVTTTTTSGSTTTMSGSCSFTTDLTLKSSGAAVTCLQQALIAAGYSIPAGATGYFGAQTQAAVAAWQKAAGITPDAGYFGPKSRAAWNLGGSSSTTTTTTTGGTTTTTTGTGVSGTTLTVAPGTQPANSLAPAGANRVPFTTFTLTASNDGPIVVNGVTVQRVGLAQDAAFAGAVLVDNTTGAQLDIAKTFNSNHQATIGGTFTIAAGTTHSFTVAGNMNSNESSYTGEAAQLAVVAVNTSANVVGSLPITGATQTINNTLTLGTATAQTSSFDPGTSQTKPIGTTGIRFSAIRLTAGSVEDVTINSIRWNQTGSAGSGDVGNVATVVNGTSYPATVDPTGKYYTTVFPGGLVVTKGNSVDMYIQGNLVGSGSAARTVEFDIYKATDIYITGNTYGYGITPSTPSASGVFVDDATNPYFKGYVVTIQAGTASIIQNDSTGVPAQNVALNVPNQPLGGFQTTILGEPISVQGMYFAISTSTLDTLTGTTNQITSVSLVDQNGNVVAGPVDASVGDGTAHGAHGVVSDTSEYDLLHFTDTVTFPVGTNSYHLIGKLPTGFSNGQTIVLSTNPSSDWSNITGQTTGNTISLSGSSSFNMNTMTVRAATTTVANGNQPSSQNMVAGAQGWTFANVQLDATQSGEDTRFSSIPLVLTVGGGGAVTDLTACQLWSNGVALNTGSNVINSNNISSSGTKTVFTLDQAFTVPHGTVATLTLDCNLSSAAASSATYSWAVDTDPTQYAITGVTSGVSVTPVIGSGTAPVMTAQTGTFTATAANTAIAQPAYMPVAAGTTGVTIGYVKFHASNEAVNLTKVGLTLAGGSGKYGSLSTGNGTSSNGGSGDVLTAYLYNGSTLVGTATFTGSGTTATSTLSTPVNLPKDTDTVLTIKADLASIGVSSSGGVGDTLTIDPLNAQGSGASSGKTINIAATAGVSGVQLFKSFPTVAFVANSTNPNGTNVTLKEFTVTANASGPIGLDQFAFSIATSSATAYNFKLYAYTDSGYSQGVSSQGSGTGQVGPATCGTQTNCVSIPTAVFTATTPVEVPAGTTYYFKLLGTVTPTNTANNWTISPTLEGDSSISTIGNAPTYIATTTTAIAAGGITSSSGAGSLTGSNFIWSDNATTTSVSNNVDWTNGYQVPGLPSTGI